MSDKTDSSHQSTLFSHLIVMGIDSLPPDLSLQDIQEGKLKPTVLEAYPSAASDSKDLPLYLTNLGLWAFPDGFEICQEDGIVIYSNESNNKYTSKPEALSFIQDVESYHTIHSFMMTDENYQKRYCSSLLFHECFPLPSEGYSPITKHPTTIFVPKSITLVSEAPYLDTQKQLLTYLFQKFISHKSKDGGERSFKIPKKYIQHVHSLLRPGLESLLHHDNNEDESKSEDSPLNLVKESKLREFHISAAYSLFPKTWPAQPAKDRVILSLKEHGKADKGEEELLRFRTSKSLGIELPTVSFQPLFEKLSPKHIIRILKCILLERQIIFFSSEPGDILYITEALLSLLWPMKWCCLYVPRLPVSIWETLHAVMPYIVGVEAQYKEFIVRHIDLMDKIVVDVDNDALYIGEDTYDFPKKQRDFLTQNFEQLYKDIKNTQAPKTPAFWAEQALKAKHIFSSFMLMLTNNYLEFFKNPKQAPWKGRSATSASEIFDFNSYFAYLGPEHSSFMEEVQHTMMFTNLIEETYEILNSHNSHLHFAISPGSKPSTVNEVTESSRIQAALNDISTESGAITPSLSDTSQLANKGKNDNQGLVMFIKELRDIVMTFQKPNLSKKKKPSFLDLADSKVLDYIDIIHSSLVQAAMKQFNVPEKIDLLPYLAKFYCKHLLYKDEASPISGLSLNREKSEQPGATDEENAFYKKLTLTKNYFEIMDPRKFAELKEMFDSFPPHFDLIQNQPTFPSRSKRALTLNLAPKSDTALELPNFSAVQEESPVPITELKHWHSQGQESPICGTGIQPRSPYVPPNASRIHGPRLNLETPKSSNGINFFEDSGYDVPKELKKAVSLMEDTNLTKKLSPQYPQTAPLSCGKAMENVNPSMKKIFERNSPAFPLTTISNEAIKLEEIDGESKSDKTPRRDSLKNSAHVTEILKAFSIPNMSSIGKKKEAQSVAAEKENPQQKERKRKLIFELRSPDEGEKFFKNPDFAMNTMHIFGISPFKETKESQFIKPSSKENENRNAENSSPENKRACLRTETNENKINPFDNISFNNRIMTQAMEKDNSCKNSKENVETEGDEIKIKVRSVDSVDADDSVKEEELQEHADDYQKFSVPN